MHDDAHRSQALLNRRAALGTVGAAAALSVTRVEPAMAQEATNDTMADHPVVGFWKWAADPATPDPEDAFAIFHADGGYISINPYAGTSLGVWQPTGERTAELVGVALNITTDLGGFEPGVVHGWDAIAVDETGNALTSQTEVELRDPYGTLILDGAWTSQAFRVMPSPRPSLSSPASTPTG